MSRLFSYCLLLLLAYIPSVSAEQVLQGAAEYTRYKRSYYIGGLYAEPDADKEAVYAGKAPAKMTILVTAKRLSQRDFRNSWVQTVAVNNDKTALEENTRDVLRFSNILKESLVAGDMIAIATDGAGAVSVDINGIEVATFSSSQLFPMLLNTWVGSVPPSTPFKNGIRGKDINKALFNQLDDHQVEESRVAVIRNWVEPAGETATQPDQAVAQSTAKKVDKPAPVVAQAKPAVKKQAESASVAKPAVTGRNDAPAVAANVVTQPPAKPEPRVQNKEIPPTAPKPTSTIAEVEQSAKPIATDTGKQSDTMKSEPKTQVAAVENAPEPAQPPPVKQEVVDNQEEMEPELTEDELVRQLLVRQSYLSDLQSAVNVHKHVPQQAIMRRVSGEVRVSVEINRSGRIQSIDFVEASKYNFFNKQAEEAINKAAPFDPVPDALPGDVFAFEVLLYYPPYF